MVFTLCWLNEETLLATRNLYELLAVVLYQLIGSQLETADY